MLMYIRLCCRLERILILILLFCRLESTAMVSIILEDNNDNATFFTSSTHVTVSEDASPGVSVFTVVADEGRDGCIEYQLLAGDIQMFSIGSVDGVVRTSASSLDREVSNMYELRVIAKDKGVPLRPSKTTLHVSVGVVNGNVTVLSPASHNATLHMCRRIHRL